MPKLSGGRIVSAQPRLPRLITVISHDSEIRYRIQGIVWILVDSIVWGC